MGDGLPEFRGGLGSAVRIGQAPASMPMPGATWRVQSQRIHWQSSSPPRVMGDCSFHLVRYRLCRWCVVGVDCNRRHV